MHDAYAVRTAGLGFELELGINGCNLGKIYSGKR
jgi:hypothetical protein